MLVKEAFIAPASYVYPPQHLAVASHSGQNYAGIQSDVEFRHLTERTWISGPDTGWVSVAAPYDVAIPEHCLPKNSNNAHHGAFFGEEPPGNVSHIKSPGSRTTNTHNKHSAHGNPRNGQNESAPPDSAKASKKLKRNVLKEQFYKTKMCPFLTIGCRHGDSCVYAHDQNELRPLPNLSKTRMCADFKSGHCAYGDACMCAHSAAELRATESFLKTKLCSWWLSGHCEAGAKCRFAHGEEELLSPVQPKAPSGMGSVSSSFSNSTLADSLDFSTESETSNHKASFRAMPSLVPSDSYSSSYSIPLGWSSSHDEKLQDDALLRKQVAISEDPRNNFEAQNSQLDPFANNDHSFTLPLQSQHSQDLPLASFSASHAVLASSVYYEDTQNITLSHDVTKDRTVAAKSLASKSLTSSRVLPAGNPFMSDNAVFHDSQLCRLAHAAAQFTPHHKKLLGNPNLRHTSSSGYEFFLDDAGTSKIGGVCSAQSSFAARKSNLGMLLPREDIGYEFGKRMEEHSILGLSESFSQQNVGKTSPFLQWLTKPDSSLLFPSGSESGGSTNLNGGLLTPPTNYFKEFEGEINAMKPESESGSAHVSSLIDSTKEDLLRRRSSDSPGIFGGGTSSPFPSIVDMLNFPDTQFGKYYSCNFCDGENDRARSYACNLSHDNGETLPLFENITNIYSHGNESCLSPSSRLLLGELLATPSHPNYSYVADNGIIGGVLDAEDLGRYIPSKNWPPLDYYDAANTSSLWKEIEGVLHDAQQLSLVEGKQRCSYDEGGDVGDCTPRLEFHRSMESPLINGGMKPIGNASVLERYNLLRGSSGMPNAWPVETAYNRESMTFFLGSDDAVNLVENTDLNEMGSPVHMPSDGGEHIYNSGFHNSLEWLMKSLKIDPPLLLHRDGHCYSHISES